MQHQTDLAPACISNGHRNRTPALRRWLTLGLIALPVGWLVHIAPATASEGAVEYRQHVMEAVGGHMQAIADILRRKVSHDAHVGLHANALADLAGIADSLFPEGSQGGDTLPAVWQKPDEFAERLENFRSATAGLVAAVDAGDAIAPAFQNVGQSCKSCHDDYRAE